MNHNLFHDENFSNYFLFLAFQTHLICAIPAYVDVHIRDPVTVQLYAMANGRKSEYHNFVYTPKEDRYSAIPSYSLQSHVAEGNY